MLTVMTLNLNYYGAKHGAWPARRVLIQDLISTSDPDVIALQAVRCDAAVEGGLDQAAQLALRLPEYQYVVYQPAERREPGVTQGSAFLSRLEIAETDHLELTLRPDVEDKNRRVLLHARFDQPAGPLHVFNGHFSWVPEQARDNFAQAVRYVNSYEGAGVLVGDFNQTPDVDLIRQYREAGWTDLWAALRSGEEGATFESDAPRLRIDYAWANAALLPHAQAIEVSGQAQETNGTRLSDHLALLVTLDLPTWRE